MQQKARQFDMPEERGETETREAIARVRVRELHILREERRHAVELSQRAGLKKIRGPPCQHHRRQVGMARVGGPKRRRGALLVAGIREFGMGGNQGLHFGGITLPNGIEELRDVFHQSECTTLCPTWTAAVRLVG